MTTADYSLLDLLADDPSTLAELDRDAICAAIRQAAKRDGQVTAATVRAALDRPVNPHRIGAVVSGLVKRGALIDTGRVARSLDARNRNSNRRLPVYAVPNLEVVR